MEKKNGTDLLNAFQKLISIQLHFFKIIYIHLYSI